MSGIGAGLDSVYEYLLKAAVMFNESEYLEMFEDMYKNIGYFLRKG